MEMLLKISELYKVSLTQPQSNSLSTSEGLKYHYPPPHSPRSLLWNSEQTRVPLYSKNTSWNHLKQKIATHLKVRKLWKKLQLKTKNKNVFPETFIPVTFLTFLSTLPLFFVSIFLYFAVISATFSVSLSSKSRATSKPTSSSRTEEIFKTRCIT